MGDDGLKGNEAFEEIRTLQKEKIKMEGKNNKIVEQRKIS